MSQPKTFKNPRRQAQATLRQIKARAQWLISQWDTPSTVSEFGEETRMVARDLWKPVGDDNPLVERIFSTHVTRKREPHEYPENQADHWSVLWGHANMLMQEAGALREFAEEQFRQALDRQNEA